MSSGDETESKGGDPVSFWLDGNGRITIQMNKRPVQLTADQAHVVALLNIRAGLDDVVNVLREVREAIDSGGQ